MTKKLIKINTLDVDYSCFTPEQYEEAMNDCHTHVLAEGKLRKLHGYFLGQAIHYYGRYIECCESEKREVKSWPFLGLTYTPRDDQND